MVAISTPGALALGVTGPIPDGVTGVPPRLRLRLLDPPPCDNQDCDNGEVFDDESGASAVCGDCGGLRYMDGTRG